MEAMIPLGIVDGDEDLDRLPEPSESAALHVSDQTIPEHWALGTYS